MTHVCLAAAATEAVALFAIPENAAKLQAAQNECKTFDLLLTLGIFISNLSFFLVHYRRRGHWEILYAMYPDSN